MTQAWRLALSCCLALWALAACSFDSKGSAPNGHYVVARDVSWFPLDLKGRSANIVAFSDELIEAIARKTQTRIDVVGGYWDTLLSNLRENIYDGVLSSIRPLNFRMATYDFSEPYFLIGPVLVVPDKSNASSLEDMAGLKVGIPQSRKADILQLEQIPSILIVNFRRASMGLEQVHLGQIDGMLMDLVKAHLFCSNIYEGRLKVVTHSLNSEGLRLVTVAGKNTHLIKVFNEGLEAVKEEGSYDLLLRKWGLQQ